ncbi:hypothetical protein RFI_23826 [Reticulomyxa filosa]|uniref:Uncharacterized protein n=1 Tax=Reticulomyxa filosa TaxID=46433 RepID=X6MI48_RETFI|nr:hypothetical protein RFI_23826 [Reticulomyxa filosa]|eukprot:ETO13544.1 hypothetical protein RFI_23826 [Reticulomyxa filosa]
MSATNPKTLLNQSNAAKKQPTPGLIAKSLHGWSTVTKIEENRQVFSHLLLFSLGIVVIPILGTIFCKDYLLEHVFHILDADTRLNISAIIGVMLAQGVGIAYVIFSWSGDDAKPSILENDEQPGSQPNTVPNTEGIPPAKPPPAQTEDSTMSESESVENEDEGDTESEPDENAHLKQE